MDVVSDLLLAIGAFGAAAYCMVLSRRLRALTALDSGLGAAIAVLSAQVDDLTRTLAAAREATQGTSGRLSAQTERAEATCRKLELLVASLHDLPAAPESEAAAPDAVATAPSAGGAHVPPLERAARSRLLRRRSERHAA